MDILTADQIEQAQDSEIIFEDVPEWGGRVGIKVMSGKDRDSFEASCIKQIGNKVTQNLDNVRSRLLSRCLCDDKGNLLFNDTAKLQNKSGAVLAHLFEVAQKHNAMNQDDIDALAGNSESGQS